MIIIIITTTVLGCLGLGQGGACRRRRHSQLICVAATPGDVTEKKETGKKKQVSEHGRSRSRPSPGIGTGMGDRAKRQMATQPRRAIPRKPWVWQMRIVQAPFFLLRLRCDSHPYPHTHARRESDELRAPREGEREGEREPSKWTYAFLGRQQGQAHAGRCRQSGYGQRGGVRETAWQPMGPRLRAPDWVLGQRRARVQNPPSVVTARQTRRMTVWQKLARCLLPAKYELTKKRAASAKHM